VTGEGRLSRRGLLAGAAAAVTRMPAPPERKQARIAITLDLEMSRNFPTPEHLHWDYEKGNLNDETKRYTVEACRRVKAAGGVVHCFVVGRVLEQADVGWLEEIVRAGHPLGNHTYDHVNVKATRGEDLQFRFRRAPWLIEGLTPEQAIRQNIRLTNSALKSRLGISANGFRTPGGFAEGLEDRPDVRKLLLELGFRWVSSRYPSHPLPQPGEKPSAQVLEGIVRAQEAAQPFDYPDGLVELPMSPISDVTAFRTGRWKLEWFLDATRRSVEWAIERRGVFDFLAHPSCLYVTDPNFRTIDLICSLVRQAGDRAALVGLDRIAVHAPPSRRPEG